MGDFLLHFILNNWITLATCVGLIIIAVRHQNLKQQTGILFICASVICLVTTFFSGLDYYFGRDEFVTLNPLRVVGSLFTYALKPLPSIFILNFICKIDSKKQRWVFGLICLPATINFLLCMFSFIFGEQLICYFTPDNHWHGGTLSFLPSVIGYMYIAGLMAVCVYRSVKRDFEEVAAVMFMIVIVVLSTVVEFFIGDEDFVLLESSPILATTAVGLLFVYFHLYITQSKNDALTGLHNRSGYYYDLQKYKAKITAIISIDMNNLKETNDSLGHDAGDLALATIGKAIKECCGNNSAYRLGGDEFSVVCFRTSEEEVISMIACIKEQLNIQHYSIAVGYCMVGGEDGLFLKDALKMADYKMYKDKHDIKEAMAKEKEKPIEQ